MPKKLDILETLVVLKLSTHFLAIQGCCYDQSQLRIKLGSVHLNRKTTADVTPQIQDLYKNSVGVCVCDNFVKFGKM